MVPGVSSSIEIVASIESVRAVLLDTTRYSEWNQYFSIDSSKPLVDLQPGDTIKLNINGMVFHPAIMENSANAFSWRATFAGLINAVHGFYFSPSQEPNGGTTLVHKEDFEGPLAFMVGLLMSPVKIKKDFEKFNVDLKDAAERVESEVGR